MSLHPHQDNGLALHAGRINDLNGDHSLLNGLTSGSIGEHDHKVISELAVNALAYGVYGITAEERDQEGNALPPVIQVADEEAIQVHIVRDSEKFGISIMDQKGTLRSSRILKKIQRHTSFDIGELPPGIEDPTGRGLFILSQQTRLVVNILLGMKTEVILMHFFDKKKNKYKSLIINEKLP